MSKADFETLAHFRYQLRRYLREGEVRNRHRGSLDDAGHGEARAMFRRCVGDRFSFTQFSRDRVVAQMGRRLSFGNRRNLALGRGEHVDGFENR